LSADKAGVGVTDHHRLAVNENPVFAYECAFADDTAGVFRMPDLKVKND